jgi:hypothetical protein
MAITRSASSENEADLAKISFLSASVSLVIFPLAMDCVETDRIDSIDPYAKAVTLSLCFLTMVALFLNESNPNAFTSG